MRSSGGTPRGMGAASLSLAGCHCRPMGTSPIETRIAPRVFGYRISKRARAWTGFISRDARASGLKRATPCHVTSTSDRTACAVPLALIAEGEAQSGWHAQRLCDGRGGGSKRATIGSSSDGGEPRCDGGRVAIACWLRLPSDGGKPQRNAKCLKPNGLSQGNFFMAPTAS